MAAASAAGTPLELAAATAAQAAAPTRQLPAQELSGLRDRVMMVVRALALAALAAVARVLSAARVLVPDQRALAVMVVLASRLLSLDQPSPMAVAVLAVTAMRAPEAVAGPEVQVVVAMVVPVSYRQGPPVRQILVAVVAAAVLERGQTMAVALLAALAS